MKMYFGGASAEGVRTPEAQSEFKIPRRQPAL